MTWANDAMQDLQLTSEEVDVLYAEAQRYGWSFVIGWCRGFYDKFGFDWPADSASPGGWCPGHQMTHSEDECRAMGPPAPPAPPADGPERDAPACGRTKPHPAHSFIVARRMKRCEGVPADGPERDVTWPQGWYTQCREGNHHQCPVGQIDGHDDCACPCHPEYERGRKDAENDYDHHMSGAECEGCNALWSHAFAMGKKDGDPRPGDDVSDGPRGSEGGASSGGVCKLMEDGVPHGPHKVSDQHFCGGVPTEVWADLANDLGDFIIATPVPVGEQQFEWKHRRDRLLNRLDALSAQAIREAVDVVERAGASPAVTDDAEQTFPVPQVCPHCAQNIDITKVSGMVYVSAPDDTQTCGCRGVPNQVCDICQGVADNPEPGA